MENELENNKIVKANQTIKKHCFNLQDTVCLVSDPSTIGVVMEVLTGGQEDKYKLFIDSSYRICYGDQLRLVRIETKVKRIALNRLNAVITANQIKHPNINNLYSLNSARVDFIPYQYRPVLKFIRLETPRMLIADGVGVGKTIEAGLIIRELQARSSKKSFEKILIICPKPLVAEKKWETEMKRFDIDFETLDGHAWKYCLHETYLEGNWPVKKPRVIVPFSLFDRAIEEKKNGIPGLLNLDPAVVFDLVIVDEAHHIRNTNTFAYKAVKHLCDYAHAVIFLTATPIQLKSDDLFVLLNVLRPDLILDKDSFDYITEPNPFINKAVRYIRSDTSEWNSLALEQLENAKHTKFGEESLASNPAFVSVQSKLKGSEIGKQERIKLINELENLHTLNNIINRTRRNDIANFTVRKPITETVEFTLIQKALYDEIIDLRKSLLASKYGSENVKFMMSTLLQQTASCVFGLIPTLKSVLKDKSNPLAAWDYEETEIVSSNQDLDPVLSSRLQEIYDKYKDIDDEDPKLQRTLDIIAQKQKLANNKIMIFSRFRHTIDYLYKNIRKQGFRVGFIHGGIKDEDRLYRRNKFQQDKNHADTYDIMLFSEVGCEGLDYQFCDCMLNYDLPWNPMKIEQRIGRIDRNGQKSETVAIYNIITNGTIDADIYERCLKRIGVFESSLGDCEIILGEIAHEISAIADNFKLSDEEKSKRFQLLADNEIRKLLEETKLETDKKEFYGIDIKLDQLEKEVLDATSFWLGPRALERLINEYINTVSLNSKSNEARQDASSEKSYFMGDKDIKTLRIAADVRKIIAEEYGGYTYFNRFNREFYNWLTSDDQHRKITFNSVTASERKDCFYISPVHPLVTLSADKLKTDEELIVNLECTTDLIPANTYYFAICSWIYSGHKQTGSIKIVATNPRLEELLIELLPKASEAENDGKIPDEVKLELEARHHKLRLSEKAEYIQKVQSDVNFKLNSLNKSFNSNQAHLDNIISLVTDERVIKMRQAEKDKKRKDYEHTKSKLEEAVKIVDITTNFLAFGTITIKGDQNNA